MTGSPHGEAQGEHDEGDRCETRWLAQAETGDGPAVASRGELLAPGGLCATDARHPGRLSRQAGVLRGNEPLPADTRWLGSAAARAAAADGADNGAGGGA